MTSAKDWAQELWDIEQSCGMNQQHENEAFIQQIQLDAIKEGMNRAAEHIGPDKIHSITEYQDRFYYSESIKDAATALTLKDL